MINIAPLTQYVILYIQALTPYNRMLKTYSILALLLLTVSGCAPYIDQENTMTPATDRAHESWKTYRNETLGFSIEIPENVLGDYTDPYSKKPLYVHEDGKHTVYFTTYSLDEAKQQNRYEFKVGGTTLEHKKNILSFLETYHDVKGCTITFEPYENTEFFRIVMSAQKENLSPDDPYACALGGKTETLYDETSGKLITYRIFEPFFFTPDGNVSEKSLASFTFTP